MAEMTAITDLLEAGARAEGLRQRAIASNIANLETPGYRRVDTAFESLLERVLDSSGEVNAEDLQDLEIEAAKLIEPRNTPVRSNGNDVNLTTEIGAMVKNSLRHKTYMRLLAKKYSQIDRAIETRS